MAKKQTIAKQVKKPFAKLVHLIGWITGVIVALAVGFAMKDETLTVPVIQSIVPIAGWIVIILTIIGVIMAIIDAIR